jgi:tetratricopeptide (TPR) repeat protein
MRRAQEINPNCATTLAWLGLFEATHGKVEKGVPYCETALRLSPRDPARGTLLLASGFAYFAVRDYAAATRAAEAALREAPSSPIPLVLASIAHVGCDDVATARRYFRDLTRVAPGLAQARLEGRWLATNPDYLRRADAYLHIAAGLAKPRSGDAPT